MMNMKKIGVKGEQKSIPLIYHSILINIFSAVTSKMVIAWQTPSSRQEKNLQEHSRGDCGIRNRTN